MALASEPDHLYRADEFRRLKRYDLALQEVQRALALDPQAAAPHIAAAWIYYDQKQGVACERAARAAVAADPNDSEAQHILAVALWSLGKRAESRTVFDTTLALPNGIQAHYLTNYARLLLSFRAYPEALVALDRAEQALAVAPYFADAHEVYGLALRQLGRDAEAEVALREALRLNAQSFTAQHNLGLHYLTRGQTNQALDQFRTALRLDPTSELARANFVLALKARNPLYGRMLSLVLRSQRSSGRRIGRWFFWGFIALLPLAAIVGTISSDAGAIVGAVWAWGAMALLVLWLLSLVWKWIGDPIFNTLLQFDPDGRQALDFDPVDGAITVGVMLALLGAVGVALATLLASGVEPVMAAATSLLTDAIIATVIVSLLRSLSGTGRRIAWGGYLALVGGLLALPIAFVGAALGIPVLPAILLFLALVCLPFGGVVLIIGSVISKRQRRREQRAMRGSL